MGHRPADQLVPLREWRPLRIAGAYAFHIAESQAYFDGNKRTGVQAALDFLEIDGVDTGQLPELAA